MLIERAASKLCEMREQSKIGDEPSPKPTSALTPPLQLLLALLMGTLPLAAIVYFLVGFELSSLGLSLAAYVIAGFLALRLIGRGFPYPTLGVPNLVTLFRLVVVAALLSASLGVANAWLIVFLATFALVLDGVDGYLARKQNWVSGFGARLDMEVDTALALVLAIIAAATQVIGVWVLFLALPRYLFVAAARFLPWLWAPLPYSLARRVVSVLQITALIVINAPILGGLFALPVAIAAALLLLWSFGRDILWLWRNR